MKTSYVVTQKGPAGPRSDKIIKWWLGSWTLFGATCPSWHMTADSAHRFATKREAAKIARLVKGAVENV